MGAGRASELSNCLFFGSTAHGDFYGTSRLAGIQDVQLFLGRHSFGQLLEQDWTDIFLRQCRVDAVHLSNVVWHQVKLQLSVEYAVAGVVKDEHILGLRGGLILSKAWMKLVVLFCRLL